jgi:DNA polymerase-3 subunit beta
MKLNISKKILQETIQQVTGVVEKKQTLPVLSNLLFDIQDSQLNVTATDMEIEIQSFASIECTENFSFTVGARNISDITKMIDEGESLEILVGENNLTVTCKSSKFVLSTLPANLYPLIEPSVSTLTFKIKESDLKDILRLTHFAMAQQDVRYYLNGMLFEISSDELKVVATDGHRLALASRSKESQILEVVHQVILPRKTVIELNRLLSFSDNEIGIELSQNHIKCYFSNLTVTSKLIDGRYPDYMRVIPAELDKIVVMDRQSLKSALMRVSILSNEKHRGVLFHFDADRLTITAHNPEHESAEETISLNYQYDALSIGFNVNYLLDILNCSDKDEVYFNIFDEQVSTLIYLDDDKSIQYVIMPMRI